MNKNIRKTHRQKRVRRKIRGNAEMPRVSVFRSNRSISVQFIDDVKGATMLGISEKHLEKATGGKTDRAKALGLLAAERAKKKKISRVVFDRGSYQYHGRVKAVAEGLREGGLQF